MKSLVIYRKNSEHEREVEGYLKEFNYRTGKTLEYVDPDTRSGTDFCRTYDINEYPTIIVVDDLGTVQNVWHGVPLPLIDEVSYYVQ